MTIYFGPIDGSLDHELEYDELEEVIDAVVGMNDKDIAPNLLTELEWQFRHARDYDTRRIAGQSKAAIEKLQMRVKELEAVNMSIESDLSR